mgnify:FL=1|tara:strand:+ start:185 stop:379 length:195 start_codon:yes stop_codon:yes gene_type:complete
MKTKLYAVHCDSHAKPYFIVKASTKKSIIAQSGIEDIELIDCFGYVEDLPHINHDIDLTSEVAQ